MWLWFLCVAAAAVYSAEGAGAGAARLVCYVEGARSFDFNECTHLIYAGDARGEKLETLLKEYRKNNPRIKIILRVTDSDEDIPALLKSKNVQGLEVYDAHRSFNKTKVSETVDAAKAALSSTGGGPLYLALPAHPELLAKYYDLRTLVKKTDLFMVHTHALGMVKKMTYHPSRLSGLWDMMNTDSVVDLVVGLGVPVSKVVISLPATARQFSLQNETLSTPGSPTDEEEPKEIDQSELCRMLRNGRWTLERDQDLSAPYAFKDKTWISFEDSSSVDVKGKYARVRGLAGLALYDADRDKENPCGLTLKAALAKVLNQQSRAPRAAVLRSLENEILSAPSNRALDALQVSPYRITQVVDADGVIHSIREDTRTEFTCSRQGYFVHPRSCARFYRCVKFDQLSADYTVFEFDCPAGLAFDSRYEVCVWPGSLPDSQACPGSSEIAPVPRTRFICPNVEGYYVDPENCRWFFACLDHGKSPLTAYEFRCPFGLGFDPARLTCDWPWLVPACAGIGRYEAEAFGFSGAALGGAAGFQGKTADSVNIAAHQSLVSGAALNNLVGIQSNILTSDASNRNGFDEFDIDRRFSDLSEARQGESSGVSYNIVPAEGINQGLLRAFDDGKGEYTSGSLILDDFRFSDKDNVEFASASDAVQFNSGKYVASTSGRYQNNNVGKYVATDAGKYRASGSGQYRADSAGKYVPSDSGQYRASASGKYVNDAGKYRAGDAGFYTASSTGRYVANDAGKYGPSNAGFYTPSSAGKYIASDAGRYVASDSGKYRPSTAGYYTASSTGKYVPSDAGKYRPSDSGQYVAGDSGKYKGLDAYPGVSPKYDLRYQSGAYYKKDDRGKYVHNSIGDHAIPYEHVSVSALPYEHTDKPYISTTDAYDTAHGGYDYPKPSIAFEDGPANTNFNDNGDTVNIGYVGKTSLVDLEPSTHKKQSNVVIEPDVTISHVGSSYQDGNEYSLVTNPISSTTASPISVTTTYKSLYVPQPPKTSFKQIFTYNQPAVTVVQPAEVAFKQFTPAVEGSRRFTENYNTGKTSEYEYSVPNIKLDIGISYTTPAPFVTVTKQIPTGFGYNEQRVEVNNGGYENSTPRPVTEEPFKKVVAYTTGPSVAEYIEPDTYQQNSYSQTTVSSTARPILVSPTTIYENPFLKYTQSNKQQTQYREDTNLNTGNYGYTTAIKSEQPQTIIYSTPQPIISVQTTVQPQIFSEQHYHTVDTGRVNTYHDSSLSGYEYSKPVNKFETVISTSAPYRSFSQKIQEKSYIQPIVTSTPQPRVDITYEQPSISTYENPFLKYTQKYSDASLVSRQEFRQSHTNIDSGYQNGKTAVFVSTTPSTLVYEDHYNEYESPQKSIKYESIELKPQIQYQQVTNIQKSFPTTNVINNYNRVEEQAPEIQIAYKREEYLPPVVTGTTPIQVSTSTKAPEYLPPLDDTYIPSTTARPRVKTVEYFPPTQSTVQITASPRTPEYLPPKASVPIITSTKAPEYLPPRVPVAIFTSTKAPEYLPPLDNTYLPPSTAKPKLNNLEYLPPVKQTISTYDYTGELPKTEGVVVSTSAPAYSTRKQNIVVETAKSNVLGFETVGTNAGLVSTKYSTPRPSLSTTVDYLPPETVTSTYSRVTKPINLRPTVTSASPTVYYEPSTARVFKGPEYLVPLEESNQQNIQTYEYSTVSPKIKYNPFSEISVSTVPTRKQNIVIESAKAQLAESDAGIITDAIEVTSSKPLRRTRPKVAVVTKLNDFNPLLVRKLGAVCSCQSPILVLRGRKPSIQTEELELEDVEQKSTNVLQNSFINTITTPAPLVSTSFNPIIVPDDSFYEDYQDSNINVDIAPAYNTVSERVKSSTPIISSTERVVKIRPRVNAVTIAPTYQTVLLEKSSSASPLVDDSETVVIDSKSFNRYGPGGWRGNDETLQGSVDCQRAGLFRHPKHCNKFYSCRWDCKKERFTLHVFNCPIQLSFDSNIGACNWPSQGPACQGDTLLTNTL